MKFGNFDYDDTLNKIFDYDKILDLWNNSFVLEGKDRYITCDAAEWGADKIIIILWFGFRIKKIIVKDKTKLSKKNDDDIKKSTADDIKKLAHEFLVPNSNICIDDDGVGKGVTTHITNCFKFHNGEKALNDENYATLQDQCLFYLANYVKDNLIYIESDAIIEEGHKERIVRELDVNKRKDADKDGKIKCIDKKEIKNIITGSPDFRDALLMRMVFVIMKKRFQPELIVVGKRKI